MARPVKSGQSWVGVFSWKSVVIYIYNILLLMVAILGLPLVAVNVFTSVKRRKTFLQRLGMQPIPRDFPKKPLWVHALSVGEVLAAIPFIKRLKKDHPHRPVVLSVSTLTGYETAQKKVANDVQAIFFYPYDVIWSVRKVARRIRPAVVFIVESDIWPNFLREMKRQQIPTILVNGRISPRSYRGYQRFSFFIRPLFSWITYVCAQSQIDAMRYLSLGVPDEKLQVAGNIKFDRDIAAMTAKESRRLREMLKIKEGQRVFLAGSTHEGEESGIVDVFLRLKEAVTDLVLVMVPRDPSRAKALCRSITRLGQTCSLMTDLKNAASGQGSAGIVVIDEMGILGRLYGLSSVAFVGGSLVARGGHNPLEPAAFGKPVLFGPDMSDFSAIAEVMVRSAGAVQVKNDDELFEISRTLLEDEAKAKEMGEKALRVFKNNRGAVGRTLRVSERFFMNR